MEATLADQVVYAQIEPGALIDPVLGVKVVPFQYRKWTANCRTLASGCCVAELHGFPLDTNPFSPAMQEALHKAWKPDQVKPAAKGIVEAAIRAMQTPPLYMGGWSGVLMAVLGPNQLLTREQLLEMDFKEVARFDNPVYTHKSGCETLATEFPGHVCYMMIKYMNYSPRWENGATVTTEREISATPMPLKKKTL